MKIIVKFQNDKILTSDNYQIVDLNVERGSFSSRAEAFYERDIDKLAVSIATDQLMNSPLASAEGNWLPTDVILGPEYDTYFDIDFVNSLGHTARVHMVGGNTEDEAIVNAKEMEFGPDPAIQDRWTVKSIIPTIYNPPTAELMISDFEERNRFYSETEKMIDMSEIPVPETDPKYLMYKQKVEENQKNFADPNYICIPYEEIYLDPTMGPEYLATIMTPGTPAWNRVVVNSLRLQETISNKKV